MKFDVLASDGSSNGWNYQGAAFSKEQADFSKQLLASGTGCGGAVACKLPDRPEGFSPSGVLGQEGQTIKERWYADRELRTVFTHDHHFATVTQNRGLFSALIVEPAEFDKRNPTTGEYSQPINQASHGTVCGRACEGTADGAIADIIGPGPDDDFREFGLALQDFVSLTRAGGDPANPADTFNPPHEPEPLPDEDPGVMGINYRNAPFLLRDTKNGQPVDPAYRFSSTGLR